jgi:hypothetical protein
MGKGIVLEPDTCDIVACSGEEGDQRVVFGLERHEGVRGNRLSVEDPVVVEAQLAALEAFGHGIEMEGKAHPTGAGRRSGQWRDVVSMGAEEVTVSAGGDGKIVSGWRDEFFRIEPERLQETRRDPQEFGGAQFCDRRGWIQNECSPSIHFVRDVVGFGSDDCIEECIAFRRREEPAYLHVRGRQHLRMFERPAAMVARKLGESGAICVVHQMASISRRTKVPSAGLQQLCSL